MAASSSSFFLLSSVALALLPLLCYASGGFSVELFHRDSVQSPLHDPSSTPLTRLRAAVDRTSARAAYFSAKNINIRSDIIPNAAEYLMTLFIGTPPVKTAAIADTGSDLIWFQCKPCDDCYVQKQPLFDPSSSSTYRSVSCKADACAALPENSCTAGGECDYFYSYGDNSYVDGTLAKETFAFHSYDGRRLVPVPKIFFGCTHQSNGTFDSAGAGLVGLGGGQLSLITQLGDAIDHKFSYCLPLLNSNNVSAGRLSFGSKAVVSGPSSVSTPITRGGKGTFFLLTLEHITVGSDHDTAAIPVRPPPATDNPKGNIIIDSGTTLTLIPYESVRVLEAKLREAVKLQPVHDPMEIFSLCFHIPYGSGEDGLVPDITFHFAGGAGVVLKPANAFVMTDAETMCLAIVSNFGLGGGDINIFGNVAQQNYEIGYDLGAMEITFAPADCGGGEGEA